MIRWNGYDKSPEGNLAEFNAAISGKTISRILPVKSDEGMLLVFSDGSCLRFGYSSDEGDTEFFEPGEERGAA